MDDLIKMMPLSEEAKNTLRVLLEVVESADEIATCTVCGKRFLQVSSKQLQRLDAALPGKADFGDVDEHCSQCVG